MSVVCQGEGDRCAYSFRSHAHVCLCVENVYVKDFL